ncbi:MAG: GntR family transcriptional regulator [Actinobacteria bacterium]|nr:GntR family transcriptional regulator [Actinomycetota bacterium]
MTEAAELEAADVAYREIRQWIAGDVYAPGSRLPEGQLASSLGFSRTPIRSALVRLSVEGLVELIPKRGAFVAKWALEDIEEIFDLRVALESYAAALAARKIGAEEIERLKALAAQMEAALANGEDDSSYIDESTELNAEFHRILIEAARSHQLGSMLTAVLELPLMHRTIAELGPVRLDRAWLEHRDLITAMETRDAGLAESVMRTHVLAARDIIRRMIAREGEAEVVREAGSARP